MDISEYIKGYDNDSAFEKMKCQMYITQTFNTWNIHKKDTLVLPLYTRKKYNTLILWINRANSFNYNHMHEQN